MSRGDLILAIEKAIGVLSQVYRNDADESDLYEASLLVLALEAAQSAGGTVLLTQDGSTSAPALRFRRAPGNLWSGDFTYALVTFPGLQKQLEIHLGVYMLGSSRVAHECDVAVIDHLEAERSRRGAVHPRHSRGLIASIEAKNYSTSPGLGIGRAFLGLSTELGQKRCSSYFRGRAHPIWPRSSRTSPARRTTSCCRARTRRLGCVRTSTSPSGTGRRACEIRRGGPTPLRRLPAVHST
ncbi:hypothetical protein ABZS86_14525 [Streptomyces sp. NPDC005355]|uniref:hypothetical protein n=1 Tax=Streptomyces sp. NPDC005355 TaxID=3157038 RepID=UPI0033A2AB2C